MRKIMATAKALPKRRESRGIEYWISREVGGIEERLLGPFCGRFGLRTAERKLAQLTSEIEAIERATIARLVITADVHPSSPAAPTYHARAIAGASPLPVRLESAETARLPSVAPERPESAEVKAAREQRASEKRAEASARECYARLWARFSGKPPEEI